MSFSSLTPAVCAIALLLPGITLAQAQQADPPSPAISKPAQQSGCENTGETETKRLFGIIPNYRTTPCLANYTPLTTAQKFKIARQDAFDPGTAVLSGAFAGEGQLSNSDRSFGQGAAGYARYFGTSYADFVIGDFMTEAIFPSLLHQDPRYFRRGHGGTLSRLGYAAGQIFWTHNDSGTSTFNYSEVGGNATAVAISNAYYPDNRNATDAGVRLATQLGVDTASNILKEFWPEISRHLPGHTKHNQ